jgi:hypothetical protein
MIDSEIVPIATVIEIEPVDSVDPLQVNYNVFCLLFVVFLFYLYIFIKME